MINKYERVKYPRTYHLPQSQSISNDDKVIHDLSIIMGMEGVITEKMDGECSTLYPDYVHARSTEYSFHPSRSWLRSKHSEIGYMIPKGFRVCGENMFAKHSIKYTNLKSYFYIFSIWNEKNEALSWEETEAWASILGLPTVPVLYRGKITKDVINDIISGLNLDNQEGFVVRPLDSFKYDQFSTNVAKYVRKNHVNTDEHWMHAEIEKNELMGK